jgi:hypothetical protein
MKDRAFVTRSRTYSRSCLAIRGVTVDKSPPWFVRLEPAVTDFVFWSRERVEDKSECGELK